MGFVPAVVAVFVYLLLNPDSALAWGPATHVRLASDVLLSVNTLPAAVAAVLSKFAMDFLYGNIAADVIFAKRLSKVKQFCHHWATGFGLLERAAKPAEKAFAYGYLTHLACDTVAHNKYIPRQVTTTGTTRSVGHLYWEIRADADVEAPYWRRLRRTIHSDFPDDDALMAREMDRGVLPFRMNRRLFNRMHRLQSHRWWYRTVRVWDRLTRWELSDQMVGRYRQEAIDCSLELLSHGADSPLLHVDPNGSLALHYTKHTRRYLRRMRRAGLLLPHVIAEMTYPHDPTMSSATGRAAG
jgi:hypothetical protein